MVNPIRIEVYRFFNTLANSDGIVSNTSAFSINGAIKKIYVTSNFSATGSLFLSSNETGEVILSFISGTLQGNLSQNLTFYPISYANDQQGNSGSPSVFVERVVNSPLFLIGSGLGNGTSGTISIYYS